MRSNKFRDSYVMQDGDYCVKELLPDRFDVGIWRGDLPTGDWRDLKHMTIAEVNKQIKSTCEWLGRHNEWDYYRPANRK
jgi:hypothetical protein